MRVEAVRTGHMAGFVEMCKELHAQTELAHLEFSRARVWELAQLCVFSDNWFGRVVLDDNDAVQGAMCGFVTPLVFSACMMGVEEGIYVRSEVPGRAGLAADMLRQFVAWCRAKGATDVRTGVISNIDNYAVDVFYRRHGFRRIGTIYALKSPGGR